MRIPVGLLVSLATLPAIACRNEDQAGPPVPALTVSKETTSITEPLRDDGTPDYALWFNREYGKGVTPENNAAVPLLGRQLLDQPVDVLRLMGIDPAHPPEELEVVGDTLNVARFEALLRGRADMAKKLPDDFSRAFGDQRRRALSAPWSDGDAPLAAAWLAANERSLTRLTEIVQARPRFWIPMALDYGLDTPLAPALPLRTLTEALRARTLRSVAGQQYEAALQDTVTGLHLAALLDQSTWLIHRIVATGLRGIISEPIVTLANPPGSRAGARALLEELERLPRRSRYDETIENERLQILGAYVDLYRAARRSPDSWYKRVQAMAKVQREMADGLGIGPWQSSFVRVPPWAIDWDELLRTLNRCHRNPACDPEQKTAHADLEPAALRKLVEAARADPAARRRIARALLTEEPMWSEFEVGASPPERYWNETEAGLRLALLSAAATVRRTEHGRYPPDAPASSSSPGYRFRYVASADGKRFSCTAAPEQPQQTGVRGFCADSSGRFAQTVDGTAPRIVDGLCDPMAETRVARRAEEGSKRPSSR